MPKKLTLVAVASIIVAGSAFAGGHSNAPAAQAMKDAIQDEGTPKGIASELRGGGAAEQEPSNRGWGNGGSELLSDGPAITDFGNKPKDD